MSNEFPVIATYAFDPVSCAAQIESLFGPYLQPYDRGIYLRGSIVPAMVPGRTYFRLDKGLDGIAVRVPVNDICDVKGDVYNINLDIVIQARRAKQVSLEPTIPVQGIRIIYAFIEEILNDNSAWSRLESCTLEAVLKKFILPEHHGNTRLISRMIDTMLDIQNDVMQFLGKDKWIMHFLKMNRTDIFIERSIDFRIFDWNRRMASKEWI